MAGKTKSVAFLLTCAACGLAYALAALPASGQTAAAATRSPNTPKAPFRLPPATAGSTNRVTSGTIAVDRIAVAGNTVFANKELLEPVRAFEGHRINAEDIENIRRILTRFYVDRGYVNSGALLENRVVTNRVLEFRIVEGTLSDVEIATDGHLARGYVRARLPRADTNGRPLNTVDIQKHLKLLKEDPKIDNLSATLGPGVRLGEAILNVQVAEARPWHIEARADNHGSPSLGSARLTASAGLLNITGWGDSALGEYTQVGESEDYLLSYSMPLLGDDTTLSVERRSSTAAVTAEPFDKLDIESSLDSASVSLNRPLLRTQSVEFSLELKLETRHAKSSLLGEPYAFSEGVVDGESKDTAIRFSQQWVKRSVESVMALHSTLNWGVDLFEPTLNDDGIPDGRFLSWTGQSQWLRRLEKWDSQLAAKSNIQIAADPLLQIEKVSLGGARTVRGYRENQIACDNAVSASLEWRIPIYRANTGFGTGRKTKVSLRALPFADWGLGWNVKADAPNPNSLWSAGLGADISIGETAHLGVFWGHPFVDVASSAVHDLQDDGIHITAKIGF